MDEQQESQPRGERTGFLQRLIKRHVIQSAAIYVAAAWGALEILITLQEKLGWPESISTWATRLFVAGFPLAVILSWRRDLESRTARLGLTVSAFAVAAVALWLTLSSDPVPRAAAAAVAPVNAALASVVVVPFENASGDAEFDYLARGFTGELIGRLSKHPDLAIIQEESLNAPSLIDLIPIARAEALSADFLVQGKVLREADSVEVTASLRDLDGNVLWSDVLREAYSAAGVIALQRRISGEISRILGTSLDSQAYCGETSDLTAMELYFRGRLKVATRDFDAVLEGVGLLEQAVDKDPYFGRAWNEFALANWYLAGQYREPDHPRHDRQKAGLSRQMALSGFRRALDICPTIGWAYKVLVPSYDGVDNEIVDQELQWRDSLAMDPNDATLLRGYFYHLMNAGMLDEALITMQRAYEIEPMLAMIAAQYAHALAQAGHCDDALPMAVEAEELGGRPAASIELLCAGQAGDAATMVAAWQDLTDLGLPHPADVLGLPALDVARALLDPADSLRPVLSDKLRGIWTQNPDFRANHHVYWVIGTATAIGDYDLVIDMLETIADGQGFRGYTLAWSPLFSNAPKSSGLRSHPRFVPLLEQTGLPEYWRKFGWPNGCEAVGDSIRCH